MQYFGGKSRIAESIAGVLNKLLEHHHAYYEPFCGGCAVAAKVVTDRPKVLADYHPSVVALFKALQSGWQPPDAVSKEQYVALKSDRKDLALDGFVGFGCSFGGKYWGGYAKGDGGNYAALAKRQLTAKMPGLRTATFICGDYRTVCQDVVGALIYCDPPYGNRTGYAGTPKFDSAAFWLWVQQAAKNNTVLVSEYNCPVPHEVLWSKQITQTAGYQADKQTAVEHLFRVLPLEIPGREAVDSGMRLSHVSASQISSFQRCPRRWWYQKVARIDIGDEVSPHTVRGSAVHYALEQYALSAREPADTVPEYLRDHRPWPAMRAWGGKEYPNPTVEELATHAIRIAEAMLSYVYPEAQVEVEFRLDTADGLPQILGYIDVYDPEHALIRDWKVRSNHRQNGLRADTDLCYSCQNPALSCSCEDPKLLSQDLQMNIYARKMLLDHPELAGVTVQHVYGGSKGPPAPFEVRAYITREQSEQFWARTVPLVAAMVEVSKMPEPEVPRLYDACNDYGGCAYRSVCRQQNDVASALDALGGDEGMTRAELMAQFQQGTTSPVNPPEDPFLAIHKFRVEALDALCDQLRQPMAVDLRGKPPTVQTEALLSYLRRWPFAECAAGYYAWALGLYPIEAAPAPPPLKPASVPAKAAEVSAEPGAPPKKRGRAQGYRGTLHDYLTRAGGLSALRQIMVQDKATPLTQAWREVRQLAVANGKPEQTAVYNAFKEEFEARKIPVEDFPRIFNSGPAPLSGPPEYAETFSAFSPTECRSSAGLDEKQVAWLIVQSMVVPHPENPDYYFVPEAFVAAWEKCKEAPADATVHRLTDAQEAVVQAAVAEAEAKGCTAPLPEPRPGHEWRRKAYTEVQYEEVPVAVERRNFFADDAPGDEAAERRSLFATLARTYQRLSEIG